MTLLVGRTPPIAALRVLWRKNVGQPVGTLPNDNTGLAIGDQQYVLWRSNFGNASSGTSAAIPAVPEPGGLFCALLLPIVASFCRLRCTMLSSRSGYA